MGNKTIIFDREMRRAVSRRDKGVAVSGLAINKGGGFVGGEALAVCDNEHRIDNDLVCQTNGACVNLVTNPGPNSNRRISWHGIWR